MPADKMTDTNFCLTVYLRSKQMSQEKRTRLKEFLENEHLDYFTATFSNDFDQHKEVFSTQNAADIW